MTRAIDVLIRFVDKLAKSEDPLVSNEVKQAAMETSRTAKELRSEGAMLYIGQGDGEVYFGTQEAATAWAKQGEGRTFRAEELIF